LLFAVYELASRLAYASVRPTHDGDWGEVEECARELETELQVLDAISKDFGAIEARAGLGKKKTEGLREQSLAKAGRLVAIARAASR
jgi:hypothetical protein